LTADGTTAHRGAGGTLGVAVTLRRRRESGARFTLLQTGAIAAAARTISVAGRRT
jgi:hypothetical protein